MTRHTRLNRKPVRSLRTHGTSAHDANHCKGFCDHWTSLRSGLQMSGLNGLYCLAITLRQTQMANSIELSGARLVARPVTVDWAAEPQSTAGPPSGYSRRGNRSPRLCFRTVLAGFLAHGSSVIRPWSWAPFRADDLHVCASPLRVIHTSLNGVLTASAARLVPITDLSPSPRQPIHGLSPRRWLLGESHHRVVSGGHLLTDAASFILGSSAKPVA